MALKNETTYSNTRMLLLNNVQFIYELSLAELELHSFEIDF